MLLDFNIKRSYLKTILILMPLDDSNVNSILSPILGQYGINVSDFLEKVSLKLQNLPKDITVRIFVDIFTNNTFDFRIDILPLNLLVSFFYHENFDIVNFYKLIFLYGFSINSINRYSLCQIFKNIQGYLVSFN